MNNLKGKRFLFCGVGGSGMSALAKIAISRGAIIYGSDRNYDHGRFSELYDGLKNHGVRMIAQDASGVTKDLDAVIVSSAIEPSIPDIAHAQKLNIQIIKRAKLLADICNAGQSICVGGTNGKSTTTAMIGHMLHTCECMPTIINGAGMIDFNRENAVIGGKNAYNVVESDESDGTIAFFSAEIAILTNISQDHKEMGELLNVFRQFLDQSSHQILNIDCPHVAKMAPDYPDAYCYSMKDPIVGLNLSIPGDHNLSNARGALKVAEILELDRNKAIAALNSFKGVTSRLEVIGVKNNITVIDDFGHNPNKIEAGLKTLKETGKRLILMYQPHGFKPTRDHRYELIDVFEKYLDRDDIFYMPDILYFGGTVEMDISSADIINPLREKGLNAHHVASKKEIEALMIGQVRPDDIICIMGARDDSLRHMARHIFENL